MTIIYRHRILNFPKGKEWNFLILLSLLGIVLNTALFTKGLEYTTPAHASLMSCMIPVMSIGSVILLPFSAKGIYFNYDLWLVQPWWIWFAAFYSIFFATVVTYSLNYYAMGFVESSKIALFIYLQPVVAGSLSVLLGRDEITLRLIISSALILFGLLLSTIETKSASEVSQ